MYCILIIHPFGCFMVEKIEFFFTNICFTNKLNWASFMKNQKNVSYPASVFFTTLVLFSLDLLIKLRLKTDGEPSRRRGSARFPHSWPTLRDWLLENKHGLLPEHIWWDRNKHYESSCPANNNHIRNSWRVSFLSEMEVQGIKRYSANRLYITYQVLALLIHAITELYLFFLSQRKRKSWLMCCQCFHSTIIYFKILLQILQFPEQCY